jgi:hypothetical protein
MRVITAEQAQEASLTPVDLELGFPDATDGTRMLQDWFAAARSRGATRVGQIAVYVVQPRGDDTRGSRERHKEGPPPSRRLSKDQAARAPLSGAFDGLLPRTNAPGAHSAWPLYGRTGGAGRRQFLRRRDFWSDALRGELPRPELPRPELPPELRRELLRRAAHFKQPAPAENRMAGMGTKESPTTAAQTAVEAMCAPLREQYERARALLDSAATGTVRTRHEVGCIVARIKHDEQRYGQQAVGRLAAALRRDETSLYRYAAVAECWDATEFVELSERRDALGRPLSWSHWVQLSAIADERARRALLERALRDGLSVRAIRVLAEGRGRPRAAATDALLRVHARSAQRSVTQWAALDAALTERRPTVPCPALDSAIEVQRRVVASATRLLERMQAARAPRCGLTYQRERGPWIAGGRGG